MEKTALRELQRLSKAAENSVLLIQRLLNLMKNMDMSEFVPDDIIFAIQVICFQLTQMDNVPIRCSKLRSQCVKAHDLQSIKKIEEDCSFVEATIREIFMLFKSKIKDFESILNSNEIKNPKGIRLLYKLAQSLH
jgi:hypothetical protein